MNLKSIKQDRQEGRIVKVIERGQTRLVGLLKNAKRELVFDADDQKFTQPIYIDHAHSHGAVAGHKVVVEIKTYKPYLKGNVVVRNLSLGYTIYTVK